jgi:hypothetical protein
VQMKEDDEGIRFHTLPRGCIVAIEFHERRGGGGSVHGGGTASVCGGACRGTGVVQERGWRTRGRRGVGAAGTRAGRGGTAVLQVVHGGSGSARHLPGRRLCGRDTGGCRNGGDGVEQG